MTDDNDNLLVRISELEVQVKTLEKDLIHDQLTGLKTRAFFEEEGKVYLDMVQNVKKGERKEWFGFKNMSLLFFDIDHFKKINDTYGHDVGDSALKAVASVINNQVREGDTVARWGGEEIAAVLLGANEDDAKDKAEEIRRHISVTKLKSTPDLSMTVSIGVVAADSYVTFEELIKRADKAMYSAKQTGRNKVVPFSELNKETVKM
jgi:diguanylate cyclase (GGDEF)-like protein